MKVRFAIQDDENSSVRIDLSRCDWDEDADRVTRLSNPGTLERSCAPWLALSTSTRVLRPSDEVEVSCDVSVPAGAAGTHWAGLLVAVRTIDEAAAQENGIRVSRELLVKIYVTSFPAVQAAVATRVSVVGLSPLTVEFCLANRMETRLDDVLGALSIQSPSRATLAETPLPRLSILPGHSANAVVVKPRSLRHSGLFLVRAATTSGPTASSQGRSFFAFRSSPSSHSEILRVLLTVRTETRCPGTSTATSTTSTRLPSRPHLVSRPSRTTSGRSTSTTTVFSRRPTSTRSAAASCRLRSEEEWEAWRRVAARSPWEVLLQPAAGGSGWRSSSLPSGSPSRRMPPKSRCPSMCVGTLFRVPRSRLPGRLRM
ncbi:MAG: hypothetical protein PHU43_04340 [Candidatus Bipolaricaulis sp.]|nr:hypothetical protein [Candidatus Bipolaricaulis sp.]